jgi:hypothetical protein
MSESMRLQRQKTGISSFSNPSLTSLNPTLANPVRGFGLPANAVPKSSNLQEAQSESEQSLEQDALIKKPLAHDISRISLRSQTSIQPALAESIRFDVIQRFENTPHDQTRTSIESDSANYLLDDGNVFIYGRVGAAAPAYSTAVGGAIAVSDLGNYQRYTPSDKFLADCLHTAEEIMHGQRLKKGEDRSQVSETGRLFGESPEDNWDAAKEVPKSRQNNNAIPGVGDAYAIVAKNAIDLGDQIGCQYHAAAVVAQDGGDNITLEVFGNPDKKGRYEKGTYNIYDTDPKSKNTFHKVWTGTFGKAAVTISLEQIPEDMEE